MNNFGINNCPECGCQDEIRTHCRNCGIRLRGSTARLITTLDCNRKCHYCCNTKEMLAQAKHISNLAKLDNYSEVCIAGEPMLYPERTFDILHSLLVRKPDRPVYLYTALATNHHDLDALLSLGLSGIHYSLHYTSNESDIVFGLQDIERLSLDFPSKSYRMWIDPTINRPITFNPMCWDRVESFKFIEDCPLPEHEELFILE